MQIGFVRIIYHTFSLTILWKWAFTWIKLKSTYSCFMKLITAHGQVEWKYRKKKNSSTTIDTYYVLGVTKTYSRCICRWEYPKLDGFCTADLKGHLFNIPCNIEDIIIADYGPYWFKPHHEAKFLWHSSHKNVKRNGFWTDKQWPKAFRTFEKKNVYFKSLNW